MFDRRATKAVVAVVAAAALVGGILSLVTQGTASATTISNALQAQTPFSPGTLDSGQPVNVVVPAGNGILTPGATIFILECSAPGGVDPTNISSCDGNTGYAHGTVRVQTDGSVNVVLHNGAPYPVYALPDVPTFGEDPNGAPVCGLGSTNECVLYIGQGGGGDPGLSLPHVFSQAFQVHPDPTDSGTINPGDGTFPPDSAPAITSASHITFTQGTVGTFSVTATGWPQPTFSETGTLPAGVTLSSSGVLSGTSSAFGSFPISISANNGVGSPATQSFTLTVQPGVSGDTIPGAAAAQSPFNPGTFDSGQPIDVVVPPNAILQPGQKLEVLECGAPHGVDPTNISSCDGNTAYSGGTITVQSDGSVDVTHTSTASKLPYIVYALPDGPTFGEDLTGVPKCAQGSANDCVLYIGQGGGQDPGLSLPHVFSQPFQVHPDPTDSGTLNPGDGTFPADSAPVITSANHTLFTQGTAGTFNVTVTGYGPPVITETGALPAGVTLSSTGALSGTTSSYGTYPITITANNGVGSPATQSFTLTVQPGVSGDTIPGAAAAQSPFSPGTFDSGQPIDVVVPSNAILQPGQKVEVLECSAPHGVDPTNISSCDGNTAYAGGTITVQSDGSVDVTHTSTASKLPYIVYALPDGPTFGEDPAGFPVCGQGTPNDCVLYIGQGGGQDPGLSLPHVFSQPFQVHPDPTDSGTLNPGDGTFPADSAPVITSANNTTFAEGSAGTFSVTATGYGPPVITETGALPTGVSLSRSGVLSGTPTQGGVFSINITASNGVGSPATQTFTLTVDAAPAITSANNTTFTEGTAGTFTVTATGTPAPTFSESGGTGLPTGVTLSTAGVLSGTPTQDGTFTFTITASNGVGSPATQPFTLTVDAAPTITSASSTTFHQGSPGSFQVTATGTPAPTFSASTGAGQTGLPSGVSLSSSGLLSGTPTVSGTFTFTVTASNGIGSPATQSFSLTVNSSGTAPTITSGSSTTFTENTSNSFTVTATGSPTPTLSESGPLPAGVTFTPSTGALSGDPTVIGTFPFTFTASNGVGSPANQSFTLTVVALRITTTSLPTAHIGQAYTAQLNAVGGVPPYKWKKLVKLPKGLKLIASTGQITGTVSTRVVAGNYSVTFLVQDHKKHGHNTAQATMTLTVTP